MLSPQEQIIDHQSLQLDHWKAEVYRLLDAVALHRRERDPNEPMSARDRKLYAAIGPVLPDAPGAASPVPATSSGRKSLEESNAAMRAAVQERQSRDETRRDGRATA